MAILLFSIQLICPGYTQIINSEWIVQGNPNSIIRVLNQNNIQQRSKPSNFVFDTLSERQNIYLFRALNDPSKLDLLKGHREFRISPNYKIKTRAVPNDTRVDQQWALENISVFDVWEETIGDFDFNGDQPVIAVIDNGFDIFHEDILENAWTNPKEIPDNNLDDDQNGYIDDYYGVFTVTENDQHPTEKHGTSTAGIIGAKGNNAKGISGMLWNSKIMYISGIESEAQVIKAYDYIYEMRKAYNDSNGEEGAYIVCNNFSGGLDNAWARDHIDWCNQYDRLGNLGILSIAAVTNKNVDVDQTGDMPTTCNSPYLIMVHDINRFNDRANSGRSKTYVDIAAPGQEIVTLSTDNGYRSFSGTSAASPHVAAAAALLFTAPCEDFYQLSINSPSESALLVKEALLIGSDKLSTLVNQNISQGKLNVYNALQRISSLCNEPLQPLSIKKLYQSNGRIILEYNTDNLEDHFLQIFDAAGKNWYSETFKSSLFGAKRKEIATNSIPQGIYFIHLSIDNRSVVKPIFLIDR